MKPTGLSQRCPKGYLQIKAQEESGSALAIALMLLVVLTFMGASSIMTSNLDLQIAANEKMYMKTFYAADTGIQTGCAALNDLKAADSGNWDSVLAGTQDLNAYIDGLGGRNVGLASFTLQVSDNDDFDDNLLVDSDNIIILTSTAQYRNSRVQIEAVVRYTGGGDQYAQEHYDAASSGTAAQESVTVTNAQRW